MVPQSTCCTWQATADPLCCSCTLMASISCATLRWYCHICRRLCCDLIVVQANSSFSRLQAEHFAKHNYQCWGVEFRGQGSLPAPTGNLVDLYLSDLFAVVDALSLRGPLPDCPLKPNRVTVAYRDRNMLTMPVPFVAVQEPLSWLSTIVAAVVLVVSWSHHCYHCN